VVVQERHVEGYLVDHLGPAELPDLDSSLRRKGRHVVVGELGSQVPQDGGNMQPTKLSVQPDPEAHDVIQGLSNIVTSSRN
jgi:hypothetical protein